MSIPERIKIIVENYELLLWAGGIFCTILFGSLGIIGRIAWYFIKRYIENSEKERDRIEDDRRRWANIESDISIIRITEEGRDSFVKGLGILVTDIKVINEHIKNNDEMCKERHKWDNWDGESERRRK
jgi:hypothetical protein